MRAARFITSLAWLALAVWAQQRMAIPHGSRETLRGVLIDGSCQDRSLWNLERAPETLSAAIPALPGGAASGQGISVDSKTLAKERSDVVPVMNPDLASRQSDPTCALKAGTRAYALLLDNGRLLDLDDGGDTYAALAVQNSAPGRALINARGPGIKPRVTVSGTVQGDRIFVDKLKLAE